MSQWTRKSNTFSPDSEETNLLFDCAGTNGDGGTTLSAIICEIPIESLNAIRATTSVVLCMLVYLLVFVIYKCSKRSKLKNAPECKEATVVSRTRRPSNVPDVLEAVAPHLSECALRLLVPETEKARNVLKQYAVGTSLETTPERILSPVPVSTPRSTDSAAGGSEKPIAVEETAVPTNPQGTASSVEAEVKQEPERSWVLLDTLCENTRLDESERFWCDLLRALGVSLDGSSSAGARVVVHALAKSVEVASETNGILRSNDVYSKAYSALTKLVGGPFLDSTLKQTFQALLEPTDKVFTCIDLLQFVSDILERIERTVDTLDPAIVTAISSTYGNVARCAPSPDNQTARTAAATLLFLRYISPGIACPAAIQDVPPTSETDDDLRVRALLTVLAKMFQAVVNGAIAPLDDSAELVAATAKIPVLPSHTCECSCSSNLAHGEAVIAASRANRAVVRRIIERVITRDQQLQWDLAEQQSLLVHTIALGAEQQALSASEFRRKQAAADVVRFIVRKFDSIENTLSLRDPHVTIQAQELVGKVTGKI